MIRELLAGSTHPLQRHPPRRAAYVLAAPPQAPRRARASRDHHPQPTGARHGHGYRLTPAGQPLGSLVLAIAPGAANGSREITADEADPAVLILDMQRNLRLDRLPRNDR